MGEVKRVKINLDAVKAAAGSLEAATEARKSREAKFVESLTPSELERYSAFKKSSFYRKHATCAMRRLLQEISGHQIHEKTLIVMCTVAKLFVGDLVEGARALAEEEGHRGPLTTAHIKAAYAKLQGEGHVPDGHSRLRLFCP
mmetsp:Transcript_6327/g.17918  ORF Transcript_6327/g.17918 Transcript_6327/m.17918 type:complete len:143 (-) Transcript_6327:253-681(-)